MCGVWGCVGATSTSSTTIQSCQQLRCSGLVVVAHRLSARLCGMASARGHARGVTVDRSLGGARCDAYAVAQPVIGEQVPGFVAMVMRMCKGSGYEHHGPASGPLGRHVHGDHKWSPAQLTSSAGEVASAECQHQASPVPFLRRGARPRCAVSLRRRSSSALLVGLLCEPTRVHLQLCTTC